MPRARDKVAWCTYYKFSLSKKGIKNHRCTRSTVDCSYLRRFEKNRIYWERRGGKGQYIDHIDLPVIWK